MKPREDAKLLFLGITWENENSHALLAADEFGKAGGLTAAMEQEREGKHLKGDLHRATAAMENY